MLTMKARLVPEGDASHRIVLSPPAAAVGRRGGRDIVCAACGTVLIEQDHPYLSLQNVVIRCPKCKQYNDTD